MSKFFEKYKATIVWIMVIGFFLGSVGLAAFQYMSPDRDPVREREEDGVAIIVNDEEIPESEFSHVYETMLERQEAMYSQFGQDFSRMLEGASGKYQELRFKSRTVDSLIQQNLVIQEAEKRGIEPDSQEVEHKFNEQLDSVLEQQGWTLDQLKEVLQAQGRSYEEFEDSWKEDIRAQLQSEKLRSEVVGEIDPSRKELEDFYEENLETYVESPPEVKASRLVFDTQTEAQQVKDRLNSEPTAFEDYAEEADYEADLGWFQQGEKPEPIDELAFSLESDEFGGPVETADGWAILRLEERKEKQVPDFVEIEDEVQQDYRDEKEQQRYNDWLEEARERATVEVKLPVVSAFREAEEDFQSGLQAYQQLLDSEGVQDNYLPYYVGRLFEEEASRLRGQLDEQEDGNLKEKIEDYEQKAVEHYMEVVREVDSNDGELLNRIIGLAPEHPEANYYLGRFHKSQKSFPMAIQSLEQAVESRPDYIAAYLELGGALEELRDYSRAVEQYEKALELAGENVNILNRLASAYFEAGEFEGAKETYRRVLEEDPDNFTAKKGLGNLYLEKENYPEAIDYYNDALSIRPDPEASLNISRAYMELDQLENARQELESLISANPYNAEGYKLLGDYYKERGDEDRALEEYREGLARTRREEIRLRLSERILELDPHDIDTRFSMAGAYRERHMYDPAINQYEEIIDLADRTTYERQAYLGLGESYLRKTEYQRAKSYFEEGLKLAETSTERLEILQGLLEADEGEHDPEDLSQTGKEALLEMAEIKVNQGNETEAEQMLNRLSEQAPDFRTDKVEELLERISPTPEDQSE